MDTALTIPEAFAAIPMAAVCCDHSFGRDEARVIREQLLTRTSFQAMGPYSFGLMISGLLQRFREQSWQGMIAAAGPLLNQAQRETAFALACQVVCADRDVAPEEQQFLTALAAQLDLGDTRARQILEVCELLQRDCLAATPPAP
jgi:hypothetical protein